MRAALQGWAAAPVRTSTPACDVVAVVLPVATQADDVGHDTAPSEAIELPTVSGVHVDPPSVVVSSTAVPLRGAPNVVAVVPVTTQSPPGRAGRVDVVVVPAVEGGPDVELAGAELPALPGAELPVPGLPGAELLVPGLTAPVQAIPLRNPVPAGRAAAGNHVAPPSLVASTEPVAWSGPEDAYVVAQQSAWLTHETAVADEAPLRTGPCIVHVAPASALARPRGPNGLVPTARHHRSARQVSAVTSVTPLGAGTADHVRPPSALTTKAPEGPGPPSSCPPATHHDAGQEMSDRKEIGDGAAVRVQRLPPSVVVSSSGTGAGTEPAVVLVEPAEPGALGATPTATALQRADVAHESAAVEVTPVSNDDRNEPGHGCAGYAALEPDRPLPLGVVDDEHAAVANASATRATDSMRGACRRGGGVVACIFFSSPAGRDVVSGLSRRRTTPPCRATPGSWRPTAGTAR